MYCNGEDEGGKTERKKMEMSMCGDKGGTESRLGHVKLMLTSKLAAAGGWGGDPPKSIGTIKSWC